MTRTNSSSALLLAVLLLSLFASSASALVDRPHPGRNTFVVRGQEQDVYYFVGSGKGPHRKVLYAPGDGGWRGFGITIAEELARAGYDVFGFDTRRYLQSFANSALAPPDIASDYRSLAEWVREADERILLVGWSEGAGLAFAAASDARSRDLFSGVVAVGATEQNILAWRWSDLVAEARKTLPKEPTFGSADFIGKIAPLPLFMIASSHDEYITETATRALFATARDPKRLSILDAGDHKFAGKTDEFFRTIAEAAAWVWSIHK